MSKSGAENYYAILHVRPNASQEDIRASYRKLVLRWHPDHASEPDAAKRFQLIQEAWETLRDAARRRAYDESQVFRGRPRREPPKVGRDALTWVENFFIQAGSIEVEGPGRGALRRFTPHELEDIWSAIVSQLRIAGESRQAIQRFQLLEHYIRRHPELPLPHDAEARLKEKTKLLLEFESLRRRASPQWMVSPPPLEELLRKRRFDEARANLMWTAAHDMADRLASTGLFDAMATGSIPLRKLSMIDRLESIAAGEIPQAVRGYGYLACRFCGAWALELGVGRPHCAYCGKKRFVPRPRTEQDDLLLALIGRNRPTLSTQYHRYLAFTQEALERWVFTPLFLLCTMAALPLIIKGGALMLPWLTALLAATGWFAGAWGSHAKLPDDMIDLFPRERIAAARAGAVVRNLCASALLLLGLLVPIWEKWGNAVAGVALGAVVFFGPEIRKRISTGRMGRKMYHDRARPA